MQDTLKQFARVIRKELRSQRESLIYNEFEVFVGCILTDLLREQLITPQEELILRRDILER